MDANWGTWARTAPHGRARDCTHGLIDWLTEIGLRYGNRIWGITLNSLLQVYRKLPYAIPVALGIRYRTCSVFNNGYGTVPADTSKNLRDPGNSAPVNIPNPNPPYIDIVDTDVTATSAQPQYAYRYQCRNLNSSSVKAITGLQFQLCYQI